MRYTYRLLLLLLLLRKGLVWREGSIGGYSPMWFNANVHLNNHQQLAFICIIMIGFQSSG